MSFGFSGVVLDMDGLLLDTERVQMEVGPAVLAQMGHDVPSDFFGSLVGVARSRAAIMLADRIGTPVDVAMLDRAWDSAIDARMADGVPLRPDVHDFLDALDDTGIPRAIATNSMTARAQGKPAPDVYLELARRLGLAPAQCIALDDSDLGVRAAMAAGMTVIQIPDMVASAEKLAHHEVASLSAARTLLRI